MYYNIYNGLTCKMKLYNQNKYDLGLIKLFVFIRTKNCYIQDNFFYTGTLKQYEQLSPINMGITDLREGCLQTGVV